MAKHRVQKRTKTILRTLYALLFKRYGPQHWWPAETPFEVIIGAILTQNTNWNNVTKAITNLKEKDLLRLDEMLGLDLEELAYLIRPSGYYNVKARRIKGFLAYFMARFSGDVKNMCLFPIRKLRSELLHVRGIGPETADSIILYALEKPIFVIDAYTRRIMRCLGLGTADTPYSDLQKVFMDHLPHRTQFFNEYHALLVRHAKDTCRTHPQCDTCVLRRLRLRQSR